MATCSSIRKRPPPLLPSLTLSKERSSNWERKRPPPIEIPIVVDDLRLRDSPPQNDAACFGGSGYGLGFIKGKYKVMEDRHRIAVGSSNEGFFGVYDGHGGCCKAAEFVAKNLHRNVLEMMKNCKEKSEKEEALKAAYLSTDRDFLQHGLVSGACCVTALIQDQELIVSNLGDCRAVLCRAGVAEALTTDHNPGRDDERERIENQGGLVDFHRGAWRVLGTLAVSRSIGDKYLKQWVIAEPETRILELEQDMEFLILASDGLWGVVSNQEAVDTVLNLLAQRKSPSESEDENNLIQGLVNVSPSSKLRRVSLLTVQSPKSAKSNSENELIWSPPLKSPKITSFEWIKKKSKSSWAKAACKDLVDLATSRGQMDDITVVVIDLNHYKC